MADLPQRTNYTAAYSGLLDNLYLTLAIAGACLGGYELLVHMPRRRGKQGRFQRVPVRAFFALKRFWTNRKRGKIRNSSSSHPSDHKRQTTEDTAQTKTSKEEIERARLGSQEDWEFGYIYQPKAWAVNASPPLPRWPLAWIATALKVKERDMPDKCGLDHTLHARFLRGCLFYTILQAFVVLPILLPLHVLYSPHDLSNSSMVKASISSLVETSGARWLWVHAVLIWWVTLTWIATTLWIAWGGLGYRRRQIKQLRHRIETGQHVRRQLTGGEDGNVAAVHGDDCEGIKRFKTIMVTNVPPDMRNEQTIRDYFEHHIHRYRARFGDGAQQPKSSPIFGRKKSEKGRQARHSSVFRKNNEKGETPHSSPVPEEELSANDCASADDEHEAREVDEVIFVRKLGPLENLRARRHAVLRQLEAAHVKLAQRILRAVASHKASPEYAPSAISTDFTHLTISPGISKKERLDLLTDALGAFVDEGPVERGESKQTVWEVLHSLPRELLDPYQALTHLSSLFRKENAPLIDYLTTKLNYLTLLVDEARSKSLDAYPPSSTAFVTFKDASTARVALSILPGHPKRSLACHTCSAPDWTDLLWSRLAKSTYRASFVRGWIVFLGVWLFTLIWIFPVSVFCTLTSLSNIAQFIKPLAKWLADNPKASSAITSLAPVILVALLTLAICPILLVISNKAETIVTRYGIHQSVMERFWKFLIVNGVVFFAIGQSAIEAYLAAFQESNFDPLPIVASAFPSAAPYFASYILLQVAIQPFFEIFRFGLPTILYVFGTRVSIIPRQRASRTNYPTFSHFSQVPQQLLAGAIMHLFMLLNPLVIPFTLIYYASCYVVWKRQFTYVYGRLYESNGRRTAIRAMRYSIDGLALAQFALFAFFILNKAKGNAIATGILFFLTLIAKLIITRAIRRRFEALDIEEADLLCPPLDTPGSSDAAHKGSENLKQPPPSNPVPFHAGVFTAIKEWIEKWRYAERSLRKATPASYRRPLPFDNTLFCTLDKFFTYDISEGGEANDTLEKPMEVGVTLKQESEETYIQLVTPHPPFPPWEDIPPYYRSRGYNDQPAYTDGYDDFLWLQRHPWSTLDLDDTIELRLSLTSSAGGDGRFGSWPLLECEEEESREWQEVLLPEGQGDTSPTGLRASLSLTPIPSNDQQALIGHLEVPAEIGSEVDDEGVTRDLFRQTARKVGMLSNLFKPHGSQFLSGPPIPLGRLSEESMTFEHRVDTDEALVNAEAGMSPRPIARREASSRSSYILPTRTSTPRPISLAREDSDTSRPSIIVTSHPHQSSETDSDPSPTSHPITGSVSAPASAFLPHSLGRSISSRHPHRSRSNSRPLEKKLSSPARPRTAGGTPSIISHDRLASGRSATTLQQQALLREVMEEERKRKKDEAEELDGLKEREERELKKERRISQGLGDHGEQTLGVPHTPRRLSFRTAAVAVGAFSRDRSSSRIVVPADQRDRSGSKTAIPEGPRNRSGSRGAITLMNVPVGGEAGVGLGVDTQGETLISPRNEGETEEGTVENNLPVPTTQRLRGRSLQGGTRETPASRGQNMTGGQDLGWGAII